MTNCTNPNPGHWIQISGASVLSILDIINGAFGQKSDKVFSDVDGADEVRHLIQQNAARRVVDYTVLNLNGPKTALVFPPIVYGQGRGPIKQHSVQIPELSRIAIQTGRAVQVGKGEDAWSNVHISNISNVFVKLVEKAVESAEGPLWNNDGIYFTGNDELCFKEISQLISKAAHSLGLIKQKDVTEISHDEADKISCPHIAAFFGESTPVSTRNGLANFLDGAPREGRWKKRFSTLFGQR